MEENVRIIKKYPNRRLYDTEESAYITLEDVRRLVVKKIPFHVVDSKTGQDITRMILLQIISEQEEEGGTPLFSNDSLQQLIRFYGDPLQAHGLITAFLERSVALFTQQQDQFRRLMEENPLVMANPIAFFSKMAGSNMAFWDNWIKSFWRLPGSGGGDS